jgi:hypothetical protein
VILDYQVNPHSENCIILQRIKREFARCEDGFGITERTFNNFTYLNDPKWRSSFGNECLSMKEVLNKFRTERYLLSYINIYDGFIKINEHTATREKISVSGCIHFLSFNLRKQIRRIKAQLDVNKNPCDYCEHVASISNDLLSHHALLDEEFRTATFAKMKYGEFLDIAKTIDFLIGVSPTTIFTVKEIRSGKFKSMEAVA